MELTGRRWLLFALGGALLLGIVFRPVPQPSVFSANANVRYQREHSLLSYKGQMLNGQLIQRRFADSVLLALKNARRVDQPVFDSRIPEVVRDEVSKRSAPLLAASSRAGTPLALAVTIADRPGVSRTSGNMLFVLPDRVAGSPCVVVLQIPVRHSERLAPAARDSFVVKAFGEFFHGFPTQQDMGPCGFFTAFGAPSTEIAVPLRKQGWVVASAGYSRGSKSPPAMWGVTPFFNKYFGNFERADGIVACASGRRETCVEGVFGREPTFGPALAPPADFVNGTRLAPLRGNSAMRAHLLDDMARDLGPEKFGRMWRSPTDMATAYAAVAGEPFDAYLVRWLQNAIGKTAVGPQLSVHILIVTLVSMMIGLGIAVLIHLTRRIS